ncbi:MAG: urease accessory UreF family protein [Cyanobacteria bacterium J06623_7]
MVNEMTLSSPAQKLAMMQLADSFYPTGSFSLSHGLETFVRQKKIQSASQLQLFVRLLLTQKVGTTDIVALIHSHRGSTQNQISAIYEADRRLYLQTAISKSRETQRQSGRALLMVASNTWNSHILDLLQQATAAGQIHCLQPVIFGSVAAIAQIPLQDAVLAFLHSLATSIISAAIRLGTIGHLQGQQILLSLAPEIESIWFRASVMTLEQMYSGTPAIDLAQMQHPNLNQRLFAN